MPEQDRNKPEQERKRMIKLFDTSDFQIFPIPQYVVSSTARKLAAFKNLSHGWNYGSGCPIRDNVYDCAKGLLLYINELGLSNTDAFPGSDGDVCITAYRFDHYLEVTVEVDSSISVSYEIGDNEEFFMENLSRAAAKKALLRAVGKIWGLSDLSIHPTMIEPGTDSIIWLLRNPLTAPGRLSSAPNVLRIPEEAFAPTSDNSTQRYQESLQFFGSSRNQIYRTAAG